jgi:hypothetical protein
MHVLPTQAVALLQQYGDVEAAVNGAFGDAAGL